MKRFRIGITALALLAVIGFVSHSSAMASGVMSASAVTTDCHGKDQSTMPTTDTMSVCCMVQTDAVVVTSTEQNASIAVLAVVPAAISPFNTDVSVRLCAIEVDPPNPVLGNLRTIIKRE